MYILYCLAQFLKVFSNESNITAILIDIDKNKVADTNFISYSLHLSLAFHCWKLILRNSHFKCRRSSSIPLNHTPIIRKRGENDFIFVIPASFNNVALTIV